MVRRTGGSAVDICEQNWSRYFDGLGVRIPARYFLTNQPIISTIQVFVDGVEVVAVTDNGLTNWRYDFATNSISFAPLIPPRPGASLEVRYHADCL